MSTRKKEKYIGSSFDELLEEEKVLEEEYQRRCIRHKALRNSEDCLLPDDQVGD